MIYKVRDRTIFFVGTKYIIAEKVDNVYCVKEYGEEGQCFGLANSIPKKIFKRYLKNLDIITATTTEKIKLLLRIK